MTRSSAITYDGLPISRGGAHKLRTRGLIDGLLAVQSFVAAVSLDTRPQNVVVELLAGEDVPLSFTAGLMAYCDAHFARRASRRIGEYASAQWSINPAELPVVIDTLEQRRPIPKAGYAGNAAVVHVTWNIVLADELRQPIPYQGREHYLGFECDGQRYLGESSVYARISETTTARLFLSLPCETLTSDVRRLAGQIQSHFPARLSSNHWKIWRLTKNGDRYVGRKLQGLASGLANAPVLTVNAKNVPNARENDHRRNRLGDA